MKFQMTAAELTQARAAIKRHFGIVNLEEDGQFYGHVYPSGERGMRYGYLARDTWKRLLVVDATHDGPDTVEEVIG